MRDVAHENRPTAQIHHHKQLEDVEGGKHGCIKRAEPRKKGNYVGTFCVQCIHNVMYMYGICILSCHL